jgi:hypothetical protein
MDLLQPTVLTDGGPWATHNMPCPVCGQRPAVLELHDGRFHPCWDCQRAGWRTLRLGRLLRRVLGRSR